MTKRSYVRKTLADYPGLAQEIDRGRHARLDPAKIPHRPWKPLWWVCSADDSHRREAPPANRTRQPLCPFCTGRRTDPKRSLAALYPALARQWHPRRNGSLTPRDVMPMSSRSVWWRDPARPGREWRAVISARVLTPRTPWARGLRGDRFNSLQTTHPHVAKMFIRCLDDKGLTPKTLTAGSNRRVLWRCPVNPQHVWPAQVCAVVKARHAGCPDCTWRVSWEQRTLFEALSTHFPHLEYEKEAVDERLIRVAGWRGGFDARLEPERLLIEYDGPRYHDSPKALDRDRRKIIAGRRAGYDVIRLRVTPLTLVTRDDIPLPPRFDVDDYVPRVLRALIVWHRRRRGFPLLHIVRS